MRCKSCGNPVSVKMEYALLKNICPYCSNNIMDKNNLQQFLSIRNDLDEVYTRIKNVNKKEEVVDIVIDFLFEKFTLVPDTPKENVQPIVAEENPVHTNMVVKSLRRSQPVPVKQDIQAEQEEDAEEVKDMTEAEAAQYMQEELEKSLKDDVSTSINKVEMSTGINKDEIDNIRQMILANANQKGEMPLNLENGGEEILMNAIAQHGVGKIMSGSSIRAKRTNDINFEPTFAGKNKSIQRVS